MCDENHEEIVSFGSRLQRKPCDGLGRQETSFGSKTRPIMAPKVDQYQRDDV